MTPKFKTKDVSKSSYTNYLKRAEECFNAAQHSLQEREWNASAINAIHCCIAACDAMRVYFCRAKIRLLFQRIMGKNSKKIEDTKEKKEFWVSIETAAKEVQSQKNYQKNITWLAVNYSTGASSTSISKSR